MLNRSSSLYCTTLSVCGVGTMGGTVFLGGLPWCYMSVFNRKYGVGLSTVWMRANFNTYCESSILVSDRENNEFIT